MAFQQDLQSAISQAVVSGISILSALNLGDVFNKYFNMFYTGDQATGQFIYAFATVVLSVWFQHSPPLANSFPVVGSFLSGGMSIVSSVSIRNLIDQYIQKYVPIQSKLMYAIFLAVLAMVLQQWLI